MKRGIDTMRLRMIDYDLNKKNNLTIEPMPYQFNDAGSKDSNVIYKDNEIVICGKKAYFNKYDNNEFQYKFDLSEKGAFVSFSAPKIYHGSNNQNINADQLLTVLESVNSDLAVNGIHTNLHNAKLSRLDIVQNETTKRKFNEYSPVFQMLQAKRKQTRIYGTNYLYHNGQTELCCYDKGLQEKIEKQRKANHDNTKEARIEVRMLNSKAIQRYNAFQSVEDLLLNYDAIDGIYLKNTQQLFRQQPSESNIITIDNNDLDSFAIQYMMKTGKTGCKTIFNEYLKSYGLQQYMERHPNTDIDQMANSFTKHSNWKNQRQAKLNIKEAMQKIMKNSNNQMFALNTKLYEELYYKFAC